MLAYLCRRVAVALLTVFAVITLSFYMIRLMPGNAASYLESQLVLAGGYTAREIQARVNSLLALQPTAPLWKQYLQYISHVAQGNLGRSMVNPSVTVLHVVAGALPWTLFSVGVALLISFVLGILAGTVMAAFANTRFVKLLTLVVSFTTAIPNYLIAIILLYLLADQHHIFPSSGAYSINTTIGWNLPFVKSVIGHAFLPVTAYVITAWGGWALSMKGCVVNTLGSDYVRAAESWGLSTTRVTKSYMGRNSMLPMVTSLALSLGFMVGGSVFIETYFSYPGMGYYLIQAVDTRDYSVMMGCFIVITVSVVAANLAVDLLYPLVDPRIARPAARRSRSAGLLGAKGDGLIGPATASVAQSEGADLPVGAPGGHA